MMQNYLVEADKAEELLQPEGFKEIFLKTDFEKLFFNFLKGNIELQDLPCHDM